MIYVKSIWKDKLKKHVKDRHYYLRMAYNSIKLKDISQMHTFCFLVDKEQQCIESFAKQYPTLDLVQFLKT